MNENKSVFLSGQSLINELMPTYYVREIDRVRVSSDPVKAWQTIRKGKLPESLLAQFLFNFRILPEMISDVIQKKKLKPILKQPTLEDIAHEKSGFQIIAEKENEEIVIGSIGKWWKTKIKFATFTPADFITFNEPDFGKLVWNLKLDPSEISGTWLSLELRVQVTDENALKHFKTYWSFVNPFSRVIRRSLLRNFQRQLGKVDEESMRLPGDEILSMANYRKTLSKTIEAPPAKLWPWLVQMGCQRAGWYSIDFLDNASRPSSDKILREFQNIEVGDILPATTKGDEGFAVLKLETEKTLVLGSPSLLPGNESHYEQEPPFKDTWTFVLEPIGDNATRLITRLRATSEPTIKAKAFGSFLGMAHQIMQRFQLKHLKERVQ